MAKALLSAEESAGTVLAYGPDVQSLAPLDGIDMATSFEVIVKARKKKVAVRLKRFSTSVALAFTLCVPDEQPVVDAAFAAGEACD